MKKEKNTCAENLTAWRQYQIIRIAEAEGRHPASLTKEEIEDINNALNKISKEGLVIIGVSIAIAVPLALILGSFFRVA